jgi:UDP-glucose 4-epimerase
MKYLVTGGAGFLGSHLVDRLLKDKHEVVIIDDFSEGKWCNLPVGDKNLTVHEISILDDIGFAFEGVDTVFHLAARTRPQESILKPHLYNKINITGTLNVLDACKDNSVRRMVFMSSSSIYGTQDVLPTNEEAPPICMSPYALTKLIGEQYCQLYERLYGLEFNSVRPFNVFGSRQPPGGGYAAAVPKFIDMLKNGETPYITGDGEQKRDFVYVDNVIDVLVGAGKCKEHGEAFNAGSETNITINNLYKMIRRLMKEDVKPDYIDRVFEPRITLSDMTKAKKLLGWKLKIGLEDGLRRMI